MLGSALEGFALSIGLILALGPQNVFVMRQGLMRSHVFAVCLACSVFDAVLITAGVLGMGSILSRIEGAEFIIAVGASIFLVSYGLLRIKSAMNPLGMTTEGEGENELAPTIAAAAAFTFLNPHVYVPLHRMHLPHILKKEQRGLEPISETKAPPKKAQEQISITRSQRHRHSCPWTSRS